MKDTGYRLRLALLIVFILGLVCFGHFALSNHKSKSIAAANSAQELTAATGVPASSSESPVPIAAASSGQSLTADIAAAARSSVNQIDDESARFMMLFQLATVLINAGDVEDARKVITDGLVVAEKIKDTNYNATKELLVGLAVRTGMADVVMPFIRTQPNESLLGLFGAYGEAQAKQGDVTGARETVKIVDAVLAELSKSNTSRVLAPGLTVNDSQRNNAFRRIGVALLDKGDLLQAATMLSNMGNDISYYVLADRVAKEAFKAGQIEYAQKLLDVSTQRLVDPSLYDANNFAGFTLVGTLAACGELERAKQMADLQAPPQRRAGFYSRIADALIEAGDFVHAHQIADTTGDSLGTLIAIGRAQAKKGDRAEAKITLLEARDAATQDKSLNAAIRDTMVFSVINAQSEIGAFSDAVNSTMLIDLFARRQFFTRLIEEEASHKDDQALQETIAAAMKTAREINPASFAEKDYIDLAEALVKVGHKDEARVVVAVAIDNLNQLDTIERVINLKFIKRIQTSMGDDAGAQKSAQLLAKADSDLSGHKPTLPGDRPPPDPKMLEAAKLMMQAQNGDEQQMKDAIARATALLGNNGEAMEGLIFASAMVTNNLPPTTVINDQIEDRQYADAMKTIQSTSGMRKDGHLSHLAQAEFADGQVQLAFETSKSIADARQRAIVLQDLLPIKVAAPK